MLVFSLVILGICLWTVEPGFTAARTAYQVFVPLSHIQKAVIIQALSQLTQIAELIPSC